jgi:tRNA dimethylallyltransferase
VPHHLIDVVDPNERYSAGRFRQEAIRAVTDILARERTPLLVGGTMLYYRSLVSGLDELPEADPGMRKEINAEAEREGWPALHAKLSSVDPEAARRIMPNDAQRIQRALEVFRLTGKPISSLQRGAAGALPFSIQGCALIPERGELHSRIEQRLDAMLRDGLVDEVRKLRSKFELNADMPSMRAVGYRQVWSFLEGDIDESELRTQAIAATRQLAKRQVTWLRGLPDLLRLDAGSPERAAVALHLLLDEGR